MRSPAAGARPQAPVEDGEASSVPPLPLVPSAKLRRGSLGRNDSEFHPRRLAIDDAPGSPIHLTVVLSICALLVAALAWSYFGRVSLYTSSPGKVQITGRTKVVEALETGKVLKIRAKDGDKVKAGDKLVELDPTDALATRTIIFQKLTDIRAETQRERIEIVAAHADKIDPSTKIPWATTVPEDVRARENGVARADLEKLSAQIATLQSRKHAKEAARDRYAQDIEAQKALVAVTQENLAMIESLTKSGFNSQAKYLDMKALLDGQQVQQTNYEGSLEDAKQAIVLVDSEIAKTREVFVATKTQTISENEQAIVDLAQQLVRADKTLANMTLRAAVAGIVHASEITTIGQVVKPGQQLMQIVPSQAPLEIEAYIPNATSGLSTRATAQPSRSMPLPTASTARSTRR